MPVVYRAYTPQSRFVPNVIVQKTPTAIAALPGYPVILSANVSADMPHHKIWAWVFAPSGTFSVVASIAFFKNNSMLFKDTFISWHSTPATGDWLRGLQASSSIAGQQDHLYPIIGGTTYVASPMRYHQSCDKIGLQIDSISGTATLDCGLFVQSENGV